MFGGSFIQFYISNLIIKKKYLVTFLMYNNIYKHILRYARKAALAYAKWFNSRNRLLQIGPLLNANLSSLTASVESLHFFHFETTDVAQICKTFAIQRKTSLTFFDFTNYAYSPSLWLKCGFNIQIHTIIILFLFYFH